MIPTIWHLSKLEWQKQKGYALFRILILGYVFLLPGLLLTGKKLEFTGNAPLDPQVLFFQFPTIWEWLAYTGNWLTYFIFGFMAVLMVSNEYSNRTMRQNIITGLHRHEFIWSKILFLILLAILATLYFGICSLTIGFLHTDNPEWRMVFEKTGMMPRFLLMTLGYMSYGLIVGALIRKTSIALFIFLVYGLFLEPVFRWGIHLQVFKNSSFNFYPLNAIEDLCPLPFSGQTEWFLKEKGFDLFLTPWQAAIASLLYVILFFAVSHMKIRRTDL
jgi:ABC-type transport system involved in multi-copper enzyme maturation permease subunit